MRYFLLSPVQELRKTALYICISVFSRCPGKISQDTTYCLHLQEHTKLSLPQDLCTCCFLHLEYSSSHLCRLALTFIVLISAHLPAPGLLRPQ